MNRIVLITAAVFFAANTHAQVAGDGPDQLQLKGNVKEVKAPYGNSSGYMHLKIDHGTNEMLMTSYGKDGNVEVTTNMKLNEAGEIKQVDRHILTVDNKSTRSYEFDNSGNKKLEKISFKGKESISKVYRYYNDGRMQQVISYNADGDIEGLETYSYHENELSIVSTDGNGNIGRTKTYIYDEHHNPVYMKLRTYGDKKEADYTYSYVYDEQGNFIKYTMYQYGKPISIFEREITYM